SGPIAGRAAHESQASLAVAESERDHRFAERGEPVDLAAVDPAEANLSVHGREEYAWFPTARWEALDSSGRQQQAPSGCSDSAGERCSGSSDSFWLTGADAGTREIGASFIPSKLRVEFCPGNKYRNLRMPGSLVPRPHFSVVVVPASPRSTAE